MDCQLKADDFWVVVPTIRPASMAAFLNSWGDFGDRLIFVEDSSEKSKEFSDVLSNLKSKAIHVSWSDIDRDLGSQSWIIPRKSDSVRSYGVLLAYRKGAKVICTMDDDCYLPKGMTSDTWIEKHLASLEASAFPSWTSTISGDLPRGYPYGEIHKRVPIHVNHGLWQNVPDLDGATQLQRERFGWKQIQYPTQVIDRDVFFPMCSMNVAWRREMTTCMYFMLMGPGWPFNRFGDIWCGLFMKKVADHLGLRVRSGDPYVWHERASNPFVNMQKEAPGLPVNEELWRRIADVEINPKATTVDMVYHDLINRVNFSGLPEPDYWKKLRDAMNIWSELVLQS